jgi:hypothetical protein
VTRWQTSKQRLKDDHQWRATPGNVIVVLDRGAARFEVPEEWVVTPSDDALRITNKPPPDDDWLLQVSVMRLRPGIDWSQLPLADLFRLAFESYREDVIEHGEVTHTRRKDLELAWAEARFVDPAERREARSRCCLARAGTVMPFLTLDYWPEDAPRCIPAWTAVVRSLRIGRYVADPTRGV